MKWKKLGLIFCPSGENDWLQSHAAVPIAVQIEKSLYKVFFSSRDSLNRSFTGYFLFDLNRPDTILDLSSRPVLGIGDLGTFDESGAMATWLIHHKNQQYLYYIGWNLARTVPFRNALGLALSTNGVDFVKYSKGPIIDRSPVDPFFCASCCILIEEDRWRMWYLSCTKWHLRNGKPEHAYHIKYAESDDGINWKREGVVAIDYENSQEYAISRPCVLHDKDCWRMWYSYRGSAYRIGYAESDDGIKWQRYDRLAGIDVSPTGWDSEMIEYPFVFDHDGQRFMLYNGNGYGKTGVGLAVLEK